MKLLNLILLSIFITFILFSSTGNADDTNISDEFPSIMRGVRPIGMGNAFIVMPGTDSNAQFYNPASINDFESKITYEIAAPMAEFDEDIFHLIGDLFDLKDDLHKAKNSKEKINYFKQFTRRFTGKYNHMSTSMVFFQARNKHFASSMILDSRTTISLRDQAFPNFELKTNTAAGPVIGGAIGLFDDKLQLGTNVKLLFMMGIEKQVTMGDILVNSINELIGFGAWKKGFGVGVDLGMKYKLPFSEDKLKPTFGITIQDLGNTYFTGDAPVLPMTISAGAGIFPKLGNVDFAILADIREINQRINFLSKFHFGIEAKFPKVIHTVFAIRAGCNQGYPAAGASATWGLATLNVAFYGEESGKYNYSKADYRGTVGLNFAF